MDQTLNQRRCGTTTTSSMHELLTLCLFFQACVHGAADRIPVILRAVVDPSQMYILSATHSSMIYKIFVKLPTHATRLLLVISFMDGGCL
ncbi:hypothetical protein KC19_1G046800 [Ceratodon purpureus]|uniref:Secreted protein n=1 Tax=Ceratodon purpureus TaxID=3225 RepID=A0A8T0J1G5_CERPU|nr:hypothetical protein KC19_1G046800 [Ceratodon purpureus]